MTLNNPLIQVVRLVTPGSNDKFFVYVTTYFQRTDYVCDGFIPLSQPVGELLEITIKVKKGGIPLLLNKPVFHQIDVSSIDMSAIDNIKVTVFENESALGSNTVPHQVETETVLRPLGSDW